MTSRRELPPTGARRLHLSAVVIAVLGAAFVAIGSSVPSVWYDEAATITGATRSWGQLWIMLHNVDAVHGMHYALMHVWFNVVGYSPFTLRLPSALAVGATAYLVALIAARFSSTRSAVCAAVLVVLIPRLTFAGTEGRSYALTALLAALATWLLLLVLSRRAAWWLWALYGLVVASMIATFLFTALLLVAHLVLTSRTSPSNRWRWSGAAVAAVLLAAPVIVVAAGESKQVAWLPTPTAKTWSDVAVAQFGEHSALFAGLLWAAAACGVVALARAGGKTVALGLACWALAPTAVLVLVSFVHPVYDPRYVTFCAPAMALLAGTALGSLRARSGAIAGLAAAVAVSLPTWWEQREPAAKDNAQWQVIADAVVRERGKAGRHDVAVYGALPKRNANSSRLVAVAYPEAFAGMGDLTLERSGAESGTLWGADAPLASRLNKLSTAERVFTVRATDVSWPVDLDGQLERRGFAVQGRQEIGGATITKYVRP